VRRILVLAVVTAAVVLGRSPAPAGACTCVEQTVDQQAADADVVLVGEVVDQAPSGETEIHDAVRNRIEVERVYVGEADAEVDVLAGAVASGACEYGFSPGRYLVFARQDDDGLHTDWCAGNVALGETAAAPVALGSGEPPVPLPVPLPRTPQEDGGSGLVGWAALAAGAVALGVGGTTLWRRRRSPVA